MLLLLLLLLLLLTINETFQFLSHFLELTDSPKNIIVQYTTDNYVILSWQPPVSTNRNSNITLYTITYTEADLNEASGDQDTLTWITQLNCSINTTSTRAKLTNLIPNTMYIAWISAWTNVGQGPLSLPVTFRTIIGNVCVLYTIRYHYSLYCILYTVYCILYRILYYIV